jgi:hypothetical protein
MYFTRTSPMIRDRNTETINTTVALNAECACDGRNTRNARPIKDGEPGRG